MDSGRVGDVVHVQQAKDGIAHGGERLRGWARADLGGIFSQPHITEQMQPIFSAGRLLKK